MIAPAFPQEQGGNPDDQGASPGAQWSDQETRAGRLLQLSTSCINFRVPSTKQTYTKETEEAKRGAAIAT